MYSSSLKERAMRCRVVNLPIIIYSDDTSGNHSKKWNKIDIWAMMFAGLPRKDDGHLENILFLCASNKVPARLRANIKSFTRT